MIYWFTSKAFSSSVSTHLDQTYFSYIVIGDIFLTLPFYFIDTFVRKIKQSVYDGTFELMLSLPISFSKIIFILGMGGFIRDLLRSLVTLTIVVFCFEFPSTWANIAKAFLFQFVFIVPFISIGFIFSLSILYFGRGESLLGYLNTLAAFLAGSFFPLSVLPNWIQKASLQFSPLTFILEQTRHLISFGGFSLPTLPIISTILSWSIVSIIIALFIFKLAVSKMRKKGFQFLITY